MWIIAIIASALFDSFKSLLGKKSSNKNLDIDLIGWSQWFFALFLLVPIMFLMGIKKPDTYFWFIVLINAVLNALATMLFWRAISKSDLSLILPIISLTPLFLLVTSPIITHEFPSFIGVIGIIVTVIGAYVVNLSKKTIGFWEPLKCIWSNIGSRLALLVSIIWSITSNLDKVAINHSSPMVYITIIHVLIALLFLPILVRKKQIKNIFQNTSQLVLVGFTSGGSLALQAYAYLGAIVPYVLSLKRISVLFGVLWGGLIFKERQFKERFFGSFIMLFGIILILIFG